MYVALSEVVWLRKVLSDIKAPSKIPTVTNKVTIAVARNPNSHNRIKHIGMKFYFVLETGTIELAYCSTE